MIRLSAIADVVFHSSQFPDRIQRDLLESLRARQIAHKFHYDSVKQTQKWLALHRQFSPSRNDENCRAIYVQSFQAAAQAANRETIHVVGLGCGGGQKDTNLIQALKRGKNEVIYTPCDVASAMVLTARGTALSALSEKRIFPMVCDLQTANDFPDALNAPGRRRARRIITFFGMIPNFEPQDILPKLASLLRPKDILLFSANLAPGNDYAAGLRRILPQYDNRPTHDWLMTFLTDLGIAKKNGNLIFKIEDANGGLKRTAAYFRFKRSCELKIDDESFAFKSGETIRLFFSYRYTPDRVRDLLTAHDLQVQKQWITESQEEGVFLCAAGN